MTDAPDKTLPNQVDLFVIGGGINGTGVARDAAGRGLSVMLVEQGDLACATSSASSKLIHGGLRYLEHYEFSLVRESLQERERLWAIAPHLIKPLRFVLPHHSEQRPAFIIRLGLFLYDHIGGRKRLPATRTLNLAKAAVGQPLKPMLRKAFEYSDCWVDDARLVVTNAKSARNEGATILPRHKFVGARRTGSHWQIDFQDRHGKTFNVKASAIVNAAGAWVKPTLKACDGVASTASSTLLVKGSHIIVPRLFEGEHAYTFQSSDGRVIFAIPYEGEFTLIGTTDEAFEGDPANVKISEEEVAYLCREIGRYFNAPPEPKDVVSAYSGVRPLYDDGSKETAVATRDYVLEYDGGGEKAPVVSIFGGKITTYRQLAEAVMARLGDAFTQNRDNWTATEVLEGGALTNAAPGSFDPGAAFESFLERLKSSYPNLSQTMLVRYARAYGTSAHDILGQAKSISDLGQHFGADLYECEVQYLIEHEWAETAEDILWRRSKLGLHLSTSEVASLEKWLSSAR